MSTRSIAAGALPAPKFTALRSLFARLLSWPAPSATAASLPDGLSRYELRDLGLEYERPSAAAMPMRDLGPYW